MKAINAYQNISLPKSNFDWKRKDILSRGSNTQSIINGAANSGVLSGKSDRIKLKS